MAFCYEIQRRERDSDGDERMTVYQKSRWDDKDVEGRACWYPSVPDYDR